MCIAAGYKLREIDPLDIKIDATEFQLNFPIEFDENEIKDQWVRINPKEASFYQLRFFEHTPKKTVQLQAKFKAALKIGIYSS